MNISYLDFSRREFCKRLIAGAAAVRLAVGAALDVKTPFKLKYITASSMYGRMKLDVILPEIRRTGAKYIDIWPERHANQREQIEQMGTDRFAALLEKHRVKLGIVTRYDLGPFALQQEMCFTKELGGSMIICGAKGPRGLKGRQLKAAVAAFIEKMKPHIEMAAKTGIVIGIENHANSLVESPDSMRWLSELAPSEHIGIALAPYHLPQDPALISGLIRDLGRRLVHFYAWQHGMGCHKKLPKKQELLQLPGRGKLDFEPIVSALKAVDYNGWTEIFMHPVPRGISILPTAEEVTDQINRSRKYLDICLENQRPKS
ncbi:MAG: sugar phosphate isomerase/epimerase [Phycisphaerales bacterium]|nr:MAG: sugar phosphate isomerase/epimerase [Phycisphaerales bacterium]